MSLSKLFKRKTKEQLLEEAINLKDIGQVEQSIELYRKIIQQNPEWATPCYNLGLIYKYRCEWRQSYELNQKATELNAGDDASWWNLGIAATALEDWKIARQAWNHFGLNLDINGLEPDMNIGRAPIRLNPDGNGEVVWGRRIDPARTIIENVPMPESKHRYNDWVLNDGAPVGQRISNGIEYAVFNELQLIKASNFKTYSATAFVKEQSQIDKLQELCDSANIGFEDWSTIRMLCKQCSEGTPHEHHDHDIRPGNDGERKFGFGSSDKAALEKILTDWATITLSEYEKLVLELD